MQEFLKLINISTRLKFQLDKHTPLDMKVGIKIENGYAKCLIQTTVLVEGMFYLFHF